MSTMRMSEATGSIPKGVIEFLFDHRDSRARHLPAPKLPEQQIDRQRYTLFAKVISPIPSSLSA
jgi:hypothetical protein